MDISRRNTALREKRESADSKARRPIDFRNIAPAGWTRLYYRHIRPALRACDASHSVRLLVVGCAAGDLAGKLMRWAERDGIDLTVLAVDTDPDVVASAQKRDSHPGIMYRVGDLRTVSNGNGAYDVVISNYMLHRLDDADVPEFLRQSGRLARRFVLHNDTYRCVPAYWLFRLCAAFRFREDEAAANRLVSIRRSFTRDDIAPLLPDGWGASRMAPFRLIIARTRVFGVVQ